MSGAPDIPSLIAAEAARQNMDPTGPLGIWRAEGSPGLSAVSPKGARGPMQLMPGTARDMGVDPTDLQDNIRGGVRYYGQQSAAFRNPVLAAAAYNAGPGNVHKYGGVPPFAETQAYVKKATGMGAPASDGIFEDAPAQSAAAPVSDDGIFADAPASDPAASPAAAPPAPATIKVQDGKIVFGDTGQPVPDAQAKTIMALHKGGLLKTDAAQGSANFPFVQRDPSDTFKPGQFYISAGPQGQLVQTPGAPNPDSGFTAGVGAGLGDIPQSIFKMLPGHGDSDLYNANEASRIIYDASHKGDTMAGAGRFTGQVLGSVPLMAGGEGLLAGLATKAPEALVPALDFLAGRGGTGLVTRTASRFMRGAQEGGVAAALTSSASDDPLADQIKTGAITGGVLRGALPFVTGAATKVFSPAEVSPSVAALSRTAVDKYKIPLRTTQIKGVADPHIAIHDSEMIGKGATGYGDNHAQQMKAFTKAVAGTFGSDADALTPDAMQAARTRIGGVFNDVAANTHITDPAPLRTGIASTLADASQVLPDSDYKPISNMGKNILSGIKNGTMSGETYQALTRKGAPLDVAANSSNANVRTYAQQLRDHLDDALEAHATPDQADALSQARWQYKNLMTVANIAKKANIEGEISPTLLNGTVNSSFKNRAFTGAGDLGELSQIGQTFLKQPANSQTAPRLMHRITQLASGPALMGAMYMLEHDPHLAIKMGATGAALGTLRLGADAASGAANRSPFMVNRLIGADQLQAGPLRGMFGRTAGHAYVPVGTLANPARLLPWYQSAEQEAPATQ